MVSYVAPDWPGEVSPPGTDAWELSAATWLLGLIPEYRTNPLLCKHPVVLASVARHVLTGALEGTRHGYRTVRTELGEQVSPPVVDAALTAYRDQGHRLAGQVRAVTVVERALLGGKLT